MKNNNSLCAIFSSFILSVNLNAQSNNIKKTPTIEPGAGYVFQTGSDFSAIRLQCAARNLILNNRLGFYYTVETKNVEIAPGKTYFRDLAGINYRVVDLFSLQAAVGVLSNSILTEQSQRIGGIRKEISLAVHPNSIPFTWTVGYSSWAKLTMTVSYRIQLVSKNTASVISTELNTPALEFPEKVIVSEQNGAGKDTVTTPQEKNSIPVVEIVNEQKPATNISELCESSKTYFPFRVAYLSESDKEKLSSLSDYLIENPKSLVRIYGNTDNIGSEIFNMKLSADRAENAKLFLVSLGVAENRISTIPLGMSRAKNANSEEERAKARNITFEIFVP